VQVVSVVRNLSLPFLIRKEGSRFEPEPDSIVLPIALAFAESRKGKSQRITTLSKISIPFWIVQTSETKSIVLSAAANTRREFKFSDAKGATEIRRIVTSGVSQAEEVPSTSKKIEDLLAKTDTLTVSLANLFVPSPIANAGQFIMEPEPSARPIRLGIKIDSPDALKRTEEFREAAQAAKLRVEAMESIQKATSEKLGGHLKVLENLIAVEIERWNNRVKTMEERTAQESADLGKMQDKQLYDIREKTKMDLRALTADFSRSANELEAFLNEMIESIRAARTHIGQKEDDIEGAISVYRELAKNLTSKMQHIDRPLKIMDEKSESMLKKSNDIKKEAETRKTSVEVEVQSQIKERNQRLGETKTEMQSKLSELNELYSRVKGACEKTERLIEERILSLQREYLDLMSMTLENDSIKGLMPLTHLDIEVFIAKYDDGSRQLITPGFTPESDVSLSTKSKPINQELDEALIRSLENWLRLDPSVRSSLDSSCQTANLLMAPESTQLLTEGLDALVRRRVMQAVEKERFQTLWSRYSGKCPKCGTATEAGAKFCQKCGFAFS
jgi:hypothetical protein